MVELFLFSWICGLGTTGSVIFYCFIVSEIWRPDNSAARRVLGGFALAQLILHITYTAWLTTTSHHGLAYAMAEIAIMDSVVVAPLAIAHWLLE